MRIYPLTWRTTRKRLACVVALTVGLFAVIVQSPANAAPLEEDIPQSPASRHVRARPVATPAAPEDLAPASGDVNSGQPAADSASAAPTAAAVAPAIASGLLSPTVPASGTAVHKYFPYTIRSGDTLEEIADLFGVQVSDITRANRRLSATDLMAGDTIRIPNPFVTREAELNAEVERLSIDKQEAERKSEQATNALAAVHSQLDEATASATHYEHDVRALPWWRAAAWGAAIAAVVMLGMMIAAIIEWWNLRARYRAVAEMNNSLRRLDYRYRMVMAKAELRLQELYGRRRRGIEDGQERPKIPEELELERLDSQIKEILEAYLEGLGPPTSRSRRAQWRESIGAVGAPIEARTARR
jgi:LysM repeat protein